MKTSYKIIAAIIVVLSLSAVVFADASAKSNQKKHQVSKTKKSKHHAKKQNAKKTKTAKESPKTEEAKKPVENNVGGEMKSRIIQ